MKTYTCKSCGATSDKAPFYASITTHCTNCWKTRQRNYNKETANERRAHDRERNNLPHRVEARASYQQTEQGKASHAASITKWRERNKTKYEAQNKVNNALRDGKITKPTQCEGCNKKTPVQGHHDDYNKPLEVRWLCSECHSAHHDSMKKGE